MTAKAAVQLVAGGLMVMLGLATFAFVFVRAAVYPARLPAGDPEEVSSVIAAGTSTPAYIFLPAIGVDARVDEVGLTYKGNMGAPDNFTDAGWYKYGPTPGEVGSAVVDGHVDNGLGTPAVFAHLKDMKAGDDIYVLLQNGATVHFVVSDVETYYYTSAPLEKIFDQHDQARLTLITCTGNWVSADQTDDHRVVVYATLVK